MLHQKFKPMKPAKAKPDKNIQEESVKVFERFVEKFKFPKIVMPKFDGIRCVFADEEGVPKTNSLLDIPNAHIRARIGSRAHVGLDGELICGLSTADDVYRRTNSMVMSEKTPPQFVNLYVFDDFTDPKLAYEERLAGLQQRIVRPESCAENETHVGIVIVPHAVCNDIADLLAVEQQYLDMGYEGLIARDQKSPYKFGRSTVNDQGMLALKRFIDAECQVIGFKEEMHNTNVATKDKFGNTERSSAKAGLVGKGTLGALECRTIDGVEFECGSGPGLTKKVRQEIWDNREQHLNRWGKYKFFPVGVKEKPRHPGWLGFRSPLDM